MHNSIRNLLIPLALLTLAPAANAQSVCWYYEVTVTSSTVQICPTGIGFACGSSVPMLRQNADSGELVELANFCVGNGTNGVACFEDECVPDGNYHYGPATEYVCVPAASCDVAYWGAATVANNGYGTSGSCARSSGDSAPTPYPAGAPWPATGNRVRTCTGGVCSSTSPTSLTMLALAFFSLALIRGRRNRRL